MCNIISLLTIICIWRAWDTQFAMHLNLHNTVINNWSSYTDMMSGYLRCISKAPILNCCSKDTSLKFVRDNLSKSSVMQAELCTFIIGGASISTQGEIILPLTLWQSYTVKVYSTTRLPTESKTISHQCITNGWIPPSTAQFSFSIHYNWYLQCWRKM